MEEKILGVLYGMAIGDAMGMPPELWSRKRLLREYGEIKGFLDGHPDNEISYQYRAGNFTDDTSQAIAILDSLIETDFVPDAASIAEHILEWARRENAFENKILGPTSRVSLQMFAEGKDPKAFSDQALSNGAAMRIPPLGTLFPAKQKKELCDYVAAISRVTHSSDITITGAAMVAMAVASALEYGDRERMLEDVYAVEEYAMSLGAETVSPMLSTRIAYGVRLAREYEGDDQGFLEALYRMMGAGVNTADSVPCAIAIAYYSFDVKKCALLCANLGGDTDTIGAMATAICGGVSGIRGIPEGYIRLIQQVNHVDFTPYAEKMMERRGKLS
ncbi:MAG: ADP-ribosylglycohydrolase family protein [Lachnospiraceae bacterium]|nr:ADP-ribosylglycohydrolase family protein [Lachnospiraceae bacterium]